MRQALNCPRCAARDTAAPSSPTVPYASNDPNNELWNPNSNIVLEAQLGRYSATRPPRTSLGAGEPELARAAQRLGQREVALRFEPQSVANGRLGSPAEWYASVLREIP